MWSTTPDKSGEPENHNWGGEMHNQHFESDHTAIQPPDHFHFIVGNRPKKESTKTKSCSSHELVLNWM